MRAQIKDMDGREVAMPPGHVEAIGELARDIDVAVAGFSIKAISNGMGGGIAFDAVFSTVVMVLAKCVASGEANGLLPEEDERNAMILRGLGLHVDIFRAQLRKSAQ